MAYIIGEEANPDVATLAGTETFICRQTTVKDCLASVISTYVIGNVMISSAATPTTGDKIVCERSGAAKLETLDAVSAYAVASGWGNASLTTPCVSGDLFLALRSSTVGKFDIDTLGTYLFASALAVGASHRALVLNINGLSTATLGDTDEYLVCQAGTAKKAAWTALAARTHDQFLTYLGARTAITAGNVADADILYVSQSATAKSVTAQVLAGYCRTEVGASIISDGFDTSLTTPLATGDLFMFERTGATLTCAVDTLVTYVDAAIGATATAASGAGSDKFVMYRSGTRSTLTLDKVSDFAVAKAWTAAAVTPTGTDVMQAQRAGANGTFALSALQTYVLTDNQANVLNISGLSSATLDGTDLIPVCEGTSAKKATITELETLLWADYKTYVAGLTDAATIAATDKFYVIQASSGLARYGTGTEIATYVHGAFAAYLHGLATEQSTIGDANKFYLTDSGTAKWTAASTVSTYVLDEAYAKTAATGGTAGDLLLIKNGSTYKTLTIDLLATYTQGTQQATILTLSTLGSAGALAAADITLVNQSGVPKESTLGGFSDYTCAAFGSYLQGLSAVSGALAGTDETYMIRGATPYSLTLTSLADYVNALGTPQAAWTTVPTGYYTATPTNTYTLAMSNTSQMKVGLPIKFTVSGTTYYATVATVSANASITIAGAPMGGDLTALYVGLPSQVVTERFYIAGDYDGGAADILASLGLQYYRWKHSKAYLVTFAAVNKVGDTTGGGGAKINAKAGGSLVSTADTNLGLQLGAAGTWVTFSAADLVAVSTTNYAVDYDEDIEIRVTAAGTTGDATGLTVMMTFVLE